MGPSHLYFYTDQITRKTLPKLMNVNPLLRKVPPEKHSTLFKTYLKKV